MELKFMPNLRQYLSSMRQYLTPFEIAVIPLDPKNRMVRGGIGLNDGKWFARVDLWFKGYRLTKRGAK
jgi:hypothetical protein